MEQTKMKTGDRIEIMPRDKSIGKSYVSKLEQVIDETTMDLHVPIAYGYLVKLPLEKPYSFIFYTENGMMRTDAQIESYFAEDGFQMMRIKLLTKTERYQRREYFRFDCSLPMKFGEVAEDYDIARDKPTPDMFIGTVKNISAGGVNFVSNHEIEMNALVKCVIPLGEVDFLTLAHVLQRQEMRDAEQKFRYRVMFLDLTALEKDKIVKYVFSEQRKALRKNKER